MFDFTHPPRAAKRVVPDGGPDGKRSCGNVGGYEAVRSREVGFTFSTGDLTRGCINAQPLVVPNVELMMVRTRCSVGKDFMAEGLKIQFAFPCGAKDTFPVSLI